MRDSRFVDLTGKKFGKWTVINHLDGRRWLCRCECGTEKAVYASNLTTGKSKSCGCARLEKPPTEDLTGQTFGRWSVVEYAGNSRWLCRCECGTEKQVIAHSLIYGKSLSCGCMQGELASKRFTKHGESDSRLYNVWRNMIARCCNPHNPRYQAYGGRGISVCREWRNDYQAFRDWAMSAGYNQDAQRNECTIDRINNDGNYEPSNCRFVSVSVQNANKRPYRNSGKWRAVELIDDDGRVIQRFPSLRDASDATGCKDCEIVRVCQGKFKTTHGMKWRYADSIHEDGVTCEVRGSMNDVTGKMGGR